MAEYRAARPEDRDELVDLANYLFKTDIERLLPKVYHENDMSHTITKVAQNESGKLIGQVAVLPQKLHVGDMTLQTNFLGIVSVHPRFRREGHMKMLMNLALDEMQGNAALSVLSGQRQRYEYFGYTSGGIQWIFTVNQSNIRHAFKKVNCDEISFVPLFGVKNWKMLSQQMNQSRPVYVERESAQLERILQCYHQIPTGIIKNGNMIGYLLKDNESKSISELELLNVQDLNKVLKAYFVEFPVEKTEIYMPDYQVRYMRTLGEIAESYRKSESNMYNILDFADVIEAFLKLKFSMNGLTHGVWSAIMGEQPVTITVTADGVSVERRADAGAVRLSKMEAQTLILTPFGRFMKTNVPNDWFPLPIYWATVDSF